MLIGNWLPEYDPSMYTNLPGKQKYGINSFSFFQRNQLEEELQSKLCSETCH